MIKENKILESVLRFGRRIIPGSIFKLSQPFYHFLLSYTGALIYGFPSRKLIVIGVTGTKGKTTTCNLIHQLLTGAGFKAGLVTTVVLKIGEKEWINELKQTMMGRFRLQKFLRQMVSEGCKYAVIETSSEGILQYRHKGIKYSLAVFTNLTPEHIERHGSFENYRAAKMKLFEKVAKVSGGISICNLDDENAEHFLKCGPKDTSGFGKEQKCEVGKRFQISDIELYPNRTEFVIAGDKITMPLIGEFNVYNAAAAICVAQSQGISMHKIKEILRCARPTPGRMEVVDCGQPFTIIVDYAHEPASLEAVYKTLKIFNPRKIIALLGAQGGGRDKRKRPELGRIAGEYADVVIVANEDPYDEKPEQIIDDVVAGISSSCHPGLDPGSRFADLDSRFRSPRLRFGEAGGNDKICEVYKITDRREAIKKALSLAEEGDIVILTGKGGEVSMCVENGKKIAWDEREIVEKLLTEANLTQ